MKRMVIVSILILIMISFNSVSAIDISLTGTVSNTSGTPVANALVRLKKIPFQAITGSDGKFSISEEISILPVDKLKKGGPVLLNNTLTFYLDKNCQRVSVEVFSCQGKLFLRKETPPLFPGKHSMVLFDRDHFAQGLYLIRVTLSKKSYFLKKIITGKNYNIVTSGHSTGLIGDKSTNINTITADTENNKRATDVLVVTATNYATKKTDIDSYQKDLTITLDAAPQEANIEFNNIDLAFDEDLITSFDRKDSLFLNILLGNSGMENALSVQCSISTDDQYIKIAKPTAGYDNIIKQETTMNQDWYKIVVDKNTPPAHTVHFNMHMVESSGKTWNDDCYFFLNPFVIENQVIDDDSIGASKGNKNGLVENNETIEYIPRFLNKADLDIQEVSALLVSHYDGVVIDDENDKWSYGDIDAGGERPPELDYVFEFNQFRNAEYISLEFLVYGKISGIQRKWVMPCKLPCKINQPPEKPQLLSPAQNAMDIEIPPTLSWECSDPENDELTYSVYLEEDEGQSELTSLISNTENKTAKIGDLDFSTTFLWQIIASDGTSNNNSSSEIYKFTTSQDYAEPFIQFYWGRCDKYMSLPDSSLVDGNIRGDILFERYNDSLLYSRNAEDTTGVILYDENSVFRATEDTLYLNGKAYPYGFILINNKITLIYPSDHKPGFLEVWIN